MRTQKEGTCKYIYKYTCAAHRDESASVSDESKHDELCHSHGTPEQHMKMQKTRQLVSEMETFFTCGGLFVCFCFLNHLIFQPSFSCFRSFLVRNDIGIILINQFIAEMIRHAIDAHMQSIPAVLEIPSKEHPYDASKDSILRRAKGMFSAEDFR